GVTEGETIPDAAARKLKRLGPEAAKSLVAVSLRQNVAEDIRGHPEVDALVACGALHRLGSNVRLGNRVWLTAAIEALPRKALHVTVADALESSHPLVRAATWSALGDRHRAADE